VKFQWAAGFHPPKNVKAREAHAAVKALPEPTPAHLVEASQAPENIFHEDFWSESDATWAYRGRLERARHIIKAIVEVRVENNVTMTYRAYEFVSEPKRWASMNDILDNPALLRAHLCDVYRRHNETGNKLSRLIAMLPESYTPLPEPPQEPSTPLMVQ
jgi:hypothetical protein